VRTVVLLILIDLFCLQGFSQEVSHFDYSGEELSSNTVYYLYEKEGKIYAATDNGITIIANGETVVLRNDSARSNSLTLIQENQAGELFVMNFRSQIFAIQDEELVLFADLNEFFETRVMSYFFIGEYLYANSYNHIKRFSLTGLEEDIAFSEKYNHITTYTEITAMGDSAILGVKVLKKDTLYISDRLKSFFTSYVPKGEHFLTPTIVGNEYYYFTSNGLLIDNNGEQHQILPVGTFTEINYFGHVNNQLWNTTNSGVILVDRDDLSSVKHWFKGIPCSFLLEDYQGNTWVGTLGQGIKVVPNQDAEFTAVEGDKVFSSLLKDDHLYLGTKAGVIWSDGRMKWNVNEKVIDIYEVSDHMFIQTKDSLLNYHDGVLQSKATSAYHNNAFTYGQTTFLSSSFSLLKVDSLVAKYANNTLGNVGDYILKKGTFQKVFFNFSDSSFYGLNGNEERIVRLSSNSYDDVFDAQGKVFKDIVYDYQEPTSQIYALYNLTEVGKFDFGKEQIAAVYNFEHIIPRKCAVCGDVIVGYQNGLLEIANLSKGESKLYDKLIFQFYSELIDLHVNDDYVYVVFTDGVHKIPISSIFEAQSNVYITDPEFRNKGEEEPFYEQHERILIDLNYYDELNHSNTIIRYKLNDNAWVEKELLDKLEFEELRHGDYTLVIEFIRHGEIIHTQKLTFHIRPHWYQTNWFRLTVALLIILIALTLYRIQIKRIRKRHEQKNKLVQAQLSAINAQMKPHFVFNTLNSIQNTILQEDKFTATQRLSEFSGFVRRILDFSRQETITLREELEMIQTYIKFEGYRFRDKFSFEISSSLDEHLMDAEIPPFIIEPYVENAVVHGISQLTEGGKVSLSIANQGNTITCIVTDNGIGIERSERKKMGEKQHKSFATEANFNRIELLTDGKVHTESSDAGTTVIITFTL
jgi:signal transduction histidine kinase